jgi:acyl-CoA thioesterase-1
MVSQLPDASSDSDSVCAAVPAPDEQLAFTVSERGGFIVPTPLVSRGKPAFDDRGLVSLEPAPVGEHLGWQTELRGQGEPWLAVHAGVGPARLLVSWAARRPGVGARCVQPASYRIESSASSTTGADGDYRLELRVTENEAPARAHVIEFDGQSWVRITFERVQAEEPVGIERLELHDASDGTDDVWLILGDELAREGLAANADGPGFAELIHERYPGYCPALIDETRSGERPEVTLARLPALLEAHSQARHVAIAYADAPNGEANTYGSDNLNADTKLKTDLSIDLSTRSNVGGEATALAALVSALIADDRSVTIARSPRRGELAGTHPGVGSSSLERVIVELEALSGLVPGPDLRSWFAAHPDQIDADGRPTPEGRRAMQRLWVEALDVLYVPQ